MKVQASGFQAYVQSIKPDSATASSGKVMQVQGRTARLDTLSISGKQKSLVERLMEQKENIKQQRDKLVSATVENGGSISSIKNQLDGYQKQLDALDEQIAEAIARQAVKQPAQSSRASAGPQTREEAQNEQLAKITNLSVSLQQAEAATRTRTRLEGSANVLESDIRMDRMHGATDADVAGKEEKLADLTARAQVLTAEIAEALASAQEGAATTAAPSAPEHTQGLQEKQGTASADDTDNKTAIQNKIADGETR